MQISIIPSDDITIIAIYIGSNANELVNPLYDITKFIRFRDMPFRMIELL